MKYPVIPSETKVNSGDMFVIDEGLRRELTPFGVEYDLPETLADADLREWTAVGNESEISAEITVAEAGKFAIVVEYFNPDGKNVTPVRVEVRTGGKVRKF